MRVLSALLIVITLVACATSPTGRRQLALFSEAELAQMGDASYEEIKANTPIETNNRINNYVKCVANEIVRPVGGAWDVTVFAEDQANAFALPGNNIGVYTGLLDVANNQDQLAAVIGHEVAHVIANHGNERVSTQAATQNAVGLVGAIAGAAAGDTSGGTGQLAMAALGLGAQVGVLLPFSRAQESEADIVGLRYMAQAGFAPRQSVNLWQNMQASGSGGGPQFLSTHPAPGNRIQQLQANMQGPLQAYQQAKAAGKRPNCG
ncbi:MAG: peptidase [Salinisphaeraceae bacterium]|nr:peptidase [Salinisphaeraceae bacterium]